MASTGAATGTRHHHDPLPFGRRLPRGQCPRCDELHDGAPARTWGGGRTEPDGTRHNHELLPFGRRLPRGQCPRCDELHDGAPARALGGVLARRCRYCGGQVEAGILFEVCKRCQIARHNCAESGCGTVCTAFDW